MLMIETIVFFNFFFQLIILFYMVIKLYPVTQTAGPVPTAKDFVT